MSESNNKSTHHWTRKNKKQTQKNAAIIGDTKIEENLLQTSSVTATGSLTTQKKFEKIQLENAKKAKKFTDNYYSSSEEDEEDLNETEILDKIFQNYSGDIKQLTKTQIFLENFFQSGSAICLICIGNIKRTDSIWSCMSCYCFFHLNCLKRWANDSIAQQKLRITDEPSGYYNNQGEFITKKQKNIRWSCPKCRIDYNPDAIPRNYECFCGKELNPVFHPWQIPHSCGERCEKLLQPECGHKCLLLCHPGPCPPCPQNISKSCCCKKSSEKTIRCFQKEWFCQKRCGKFLSCGLHQCESLCHSKCSPCSKKRQQKCLCGQDSRERNCAEIFWQCNKICEKELNCGLHKCKKLCHAEDCGECPLSLPRTCPCGKNKIVAPCSELIEPCGDTCLKTLTCGKHYCQHRCHKGECSACTEIIVKNCRCGLHSKELPCSKNFSCETKCKLTKECGKHPCNKKCCDGQCPPCDKICGKLLSCKKHKCKSICHDGPCYPCELKSLVKCRCGNTSMEVPCGREKRVKPPKCNKPCRVSSKCHHENPHKCHFNDCLPCSQKCGLKNDVTNCNHPCQEKCHSAVKIYSKKQQPANIWDVIPEFEFVKLPHPKCEIKVEATCIGGHETCLIPCWNSKPTSCQRICGRILKCGNHYCEKICHTVKVLQDKNAQETCNSCQESCQKKRSNGCIHQCRKSCHLPPCESCNIFLRMSCHCGLTQVCVKCSEFNAPNLDDKELRAIKEKLQSCKDRCIKNYACGHRCNSICHSGSCPNPENCKKKIKIFCDCKNLKMEVSCEKYRNGLTKLQCDDKCENKKSIEAQSKFEQESKLRAEENERNRTEIEQFEKKILGKRKHRERKICTSKTDNNNRTKVWLSIGGISSIIIGILIFYSFK